MKRGELIQVEPPGRRLLFQLNPTTLTWGGRNARLSSIDRPRRVTATEWEGRGPRTVEFTLRLDGYPDTPVTEQLLTLSAMAGIPHADRPPPKVQLRYPAVHPIRWVIETLERGEEIRRSDLQIVRIDVDVQLREWVTPDLVTSPARRVQSNATASGDGSTGRTHTVVAGDTLWALADRYLGSGPRWQEIADLNGVRDPRTLQIGTRLRIPA